MRRLLCLVAVFILVGCSAPTEPEPPRINHEPEQTIDTVVAESADETPSFLLIPHPTTKRNPGTLEDEPAREPVQSDPPVAGTKDTRLPQKIAATPEQPLPHLAPTPQDSGGSSPSVSVRAGGESVTLVTVTGTGTVDITLSRAPGSAAPNLPTYVSSLCDGRSVYSGARNTTGVNQHLTVSFTGRSCAIKIKVSQPSARWTDTTSFVQASVGEIKNTTTVGAVYDATWVSVPVTGTRTLSLPVPEGFSGQLDVKLTACSSTGGTSDSSIQLGCGNHVQPGIGSTVRIDLIDETGVVSSNISSISAREHHSMVHMSIPRSTGAMSLRITHMDGSAMLVHGPGTRAIG